MSEQNTEQAGDAPAPNHKETAMQVYVFTVAVMGEDVQDAAETMRERTIEAWNLQDAIYTEGMDCQVTESVRVTPDPPKTVSREDPEPRPTSNTTARFIPGDGFLGWSWRHAYAMNRRYFAFALPADRTLCADIRRICVPEIASMPDPSPGEGAGDYSERVHDVAPASDRCEFEHPHPDHPCGRRPTFDLADAIREAFSLDATDPLQLFADLMRYVLHLEGRGGSGGSPEREEGAKG